MSRVYSYLEIFYILCLAFVFSGVLVLGSIVAPVVFHSSEFITNVTLDRFQNGQLMAEIFSRFATILNFVVLFIVVIEALNYKRFLQSGLYMVFFAIFVVSSFIFSFYFTSIILELIAKGENVINQNIEAFETLHKLSEYDFMVVMFSALAMFLVKLNNFSKH